MSAEMGQEGRLALVLSASGDRRAYAPVVTALSESGLEPVVIRMDDVVAGRQELVVAIAEDGVQLRCDGLEFRPWNVAVAWWRKPQWTGVRRDDQALQASLQLELDRQSQALAGLVPNSVWLNAPDAMRAAEGKFRQLRRASDFGFGTPLTVASSRWRPVIEAFDATPLVYKALRGTLHSAAENEIVFTTALPHEDLKTLSASARPWPGVFQQQVVAAREWRVTVVGNDVHPASVHLEGDLVDWRRHQVTDAVEFRREPLADWAVDACRRLTHAFGLRYAAIDLIEDPNGDIWFLELNPNGQYGWLEDELGLPVTDSIVTELLRIAREGPSVAESRSAYRGGGHAS